MDIDVKAEVIEQKVLVKVGGKPLDNIKQEQFCRNVVAGMNHADAYQSIHECTRSTAKSQASRWVKGNALIKARIRALSDDTPLIKLKAINLREKRDILAGIIDGIGAQGRERELIVTALTLMMEESIDDDATLEIRNLRKKVEKGEYISHTSVKDVIAAMRLDAQLAGEFAPTEHHQLSLSVNADDPSSPEFQKRLAAAAQIIQKRRKSGKVLEERTELT